MSKYVLFLAVYCASSFCIEDEDTIRRSAVS